MKLAFILFLAVKFYYRNINIFWLEEKKNFELFSWEEKNLRLQFKCFLNKPWSSGDFSWKVSQNFIWKFYLGASNRPLLPTFQTLIRFSSGGISSKLTKTFIFSNRKERDKGNIKFSLFYLLTSGFLSHFSSDTIFSLFSLYCTNFPSKSPSPPHFLHFQGEMDIKYV